MEPTGLKTPVLRPHLDATVCFANIPGQPEANRDLKNLSLWDEILADLWGMAEL